MRDQLPRNSVLTAYHSIFLSHCSYEIITWKRTPHADRIFKLQRKLLRVMFKMKYRDDVAEAFVKNKSFTSSLHIYTCLVKENLDTYTLNSEIHNQQTYKSFK